MMFLTDMTLSILAVLMQGGTIAAIYVQNGEHVAKGASLIRLDDTVSDSEASLSALSVDKLLAQKTRLEAEQIGASTITFPPKLTARFYPTAARAMTDERKMFAARRSERAGMATQLAARVTQYEQQIAGLSPRLRQTIVRWP